MAKQIITKEDIEHQIDDLVTNISMKQFDYGTDFDLKYHTRIALIELSNWFELKIIGQRKKDFEAGWKACESHFDPMSEIGGASMQVKADFEQYINQ